MNFGSEQVAWEQISWAFTHPQVYLWVLPLLGVVAEIVANLLENAFRYSSPGSAIGISFNKTGICVWDDGSVIPDSERNKIFKKRTTSNIARINIDPEEDDIIIFPSKTLHGTQKNIDNKERISISADISILARESKNLEHLTPPFSEWKKFTNN